MPDATKLPWEYRYELLLFYEISKFGSLTWVWYRAAKIVISGMISVFGIISVLSLVCTGVLSRQFV